MTLQALPTNETDLLQHAFRTFDHAADQLQKSYAALTVRLEQLDMELAERNQALRQKLHENETMRAHLSAILESLTTGVVVVGTAGEIERVNRAASRLLGLVETELEGRTWDEVSDQLELRVGSYPISLSNGAVVTATDSPLTNAQGDILGRIILLQDVTTIHRLEEQLHRRDRLAAMGEMVGHIAHEIRNPLGSIELFASLLQRDLKSSPTLRRYAEQISTAVHILDRLLGNLLLYTKPDCSRARWHALEPIVLDALALAASSIARCRVDIRLNIGFPATRLWCDADQLRQVLLNVILNAVHAMPEGGRMTIGSDAEIDGKGRLLAITLTVSDTGVGIPASHLSRIFDPFFTTREDGNGLGLAIVHAIVEGHGGRITVESTVGQGTTFTFCFPGGPERPPGSRDNNAGIEQVRAPREPRLLTHQEWIPA
jgi:signal transduction histidine kinase